MIFVQTFLALNNLDLVLFIRRFHDLHVPLSPSGRLAVPVDAMPRCLRAPATRHGFRIKVVDVVLDRVFLALLRAVCLAEDARVGQNRDIVPW